jgi:hypothetical protein
VKLVWLVDSGWWLVTIYKPTIHKRPSTSHDPGIPPLQPA